MGQDTMTNRWQPYVWMLCGSLAFAIMSTLTHALRNDCDWRIIAFLRATMACLFAAILAAMNGVQLVWLRPRTLWLRSIAGSISLVCAFFAVTHMGVPETLTLTNTLSHLDRAVVMANVRRAAAGARLAGGSHGHRWRCVDNESRLERNQLGGLPRAR
jgi:hypothetical protein